MALIQVVNPKIKNNMAMIMMDITVLRVDKVLAFTSSIFFFTINNF